MKTLNKNMGQNGAAAVEFAIVLPLLVILVFGIIEFSILFYNKAMITNASREGARAGIVFVEDREDPNVLNSLNNHITDVVKAYCKDYLITFGNDNLTILPPSWSGAEAGDSLTVTVKYHYDFLVLPNFISKLLGGVNLSAVTIMRLE